MKQASIDTRFFRAGVGTVIYNSEGKLAFFKRAKFPIGVWQFQQGGIDIDESIETTLWRELAEEVGLTEDDFEQVTEMPKWTVYPSSDALEDSTKSRLGQAHKWFFLKLKDEVIIDLNKATDKEASDFRFVDFAEAIAETEDLKKPVYQQLEQYFLANIDLS